MLFMQAQFVLGLSGLQVPAPTTLNTSASCAGPSWVFPGVIAAACGFVVSLGGRRAFSGIMAEE